MTCSMNIDHDSFISEMKRVETLDVEYLVRAQLFTREDFWEHQETYFIKRKIFGKCRVHIAMK